MSFAISPTAFVVVGARAAPRGGAKARASSTRVTARVSGARVRVSPDLRGRNATALRASEDDPPPKEPAAPEQLSFPELSDDEEVRGSQITAIVTGVVSVVLAVGYLALVQVMDSREMLPPPPEAMGNGECPLGERRC